MRSWGCSPRDENSAFIRDQRALSLSPSPSSSPSLPLSPSPPLPLTLPSEDSARRQPHASPEESFHQNLIKLAPWPWTSKSSELWETKFCCLSHLVLRYFVIAAWAGEDTGMASVWLATGVQSWSLESCFSHLVSELSLPSWGSILKKAYAPVKLHCLPDSSWKGSLDGGIFFYSRNPSKTPFHLIGSDRETCQFLNQSLWPETVTCWLPLALAMCFTLILGA